MATTGVACLSFGEAINTCIRKYAVFSGRAGRTEYWSWVLASLFVEFLIVAVAQDQYWTWSLVFELSIALPTVAVACRRLRDINCSGWWQLLGLVPIIGDIALIVLTCLPGTAGPNRFGTRTASCGAPCTRPLALRQHRANPEDQP